MISDQDRIKNQIERWGSLPSGQRESMDVMMIRALMQLSACVADQKRVIDGGIPIRPLSSYPDPLLYFEN
jgi:hypothetical protein